MRSELAAEPIIKLDMWPEGCYTYDQVRDIKYQDNIGHVKLDELSLSNQDKITNGFERVLKSIKSISIPDSIIAFTAENIYYKDLIDIYNQMLTNGFNNYMHALDTIYIYNNGTSLNRPFIGESRIVGFPWQERTYELPPRLFEAPFKTIWQQYLASFSKEYPYYFIAYCIAFIGLFVFGALIPIRFCIKKVLNLC